MSISVSDPRSNFNDQIAHAANVLKRSARLRSVFEAICKGGKKPKTAATLMKATGFNHVAVLQLGGKLTDQHLVHKTKVGSKTAYEKDRFYATNRSRIMGYAMNPTKLKGLPTKVSPRAVTGAGNIRVSIRGVRIQIDEVTCDDIDQFAKVRQAKTANHQVISERAFKDGIKKLLGESGIFQDWGGEKNDLFTSKIRLKGKRRTVAFAFKGPGTTGILTPKKLGKNGNQIQRLFLSPAEIFIVQYHGQIDQDVIEQMRAFATLNSVSQDKRIWYGVINGDDTDRLLSAYSRQFSARQTTRRSSRKT